MPLISNSRKRSRGNFEQGPGGTPLEGWDFIQEKILSHDEDMIADYADDIDTLLVFAGLFSAVLTAFLVVSLVLLQPDNSQLSVQLLSIIALQNGAPARMQPFLNETAESLPTSTGFRAASSAATINTLWFTSLVLSLAAALFGILAKQWCREYLRWHGVIASARENVLIRQVRFEAWEQWRVASIIASIPAFLQIALILFFIGLLIFVPSLSEHCLVAVVSVVIGGVLLGTMVLTLLPAFYRLCPFQSPTSWVFVLLAELSRNTSHLLIHRIISAFHQLYAIAMRGTAELQHPRWADRPGLPTSWRDYGLHSVACACLCGPAVPEFKEACADVNIDVNVWKWAAVDAVQTRMLTRALAWVRRGSQNEDVFAAILVSLRSIHYNWKSHILNKPHFLASAYSLYPVDPTLLLGFMQSSFYEASTTHLSFRPILKTHFPLWLRIGPFCALSRAHSLPAHLEQYQPVYGAWQEDGTSLEICHALVRLDILYLTDDWLTAHAWDDGVTRRALAERIALLLSLLRAVHTLLPVGSAQHYGRELEEVYWKLAPHQAAYSDGLMSMCLELSCLVGSVTILRGEGAPHIITGENTIPYSAPDKVQEDLRDVGWAEFAIAIYDSSDGYEQPDMRHLFVVVVSRVFEIIQIRTHNAAGATYPEDTTTMAGLLSRMVVALQWSLVHSSLNCGAYISLPWSTNILDCYETAQALWTCDPVELIPLTGEPTLRPTFLLVLRLLESCLYRGLLTGSTTAGDLRRLMAILKYPTLPELPDAFQAIDGTPVSFPYDNDRLSEDAVSGRSSSWSFHPPDRYAGVVEVRANDAELAARGDRDTETADGVGLTSLELNIANYAASAEGMFAESSQDCHIPPQAASDMQLVYHSSPASRPAPRASQLDISPTKGPQANPYSRPGSASRGEPVTPSTTNQPSLNAHNDEQLEFARTKHISTNTTTGGALGLSLNEPGVVLDMA